MHMHICKFIYISACINKYIFIVFFLLIKGLNHEYNSTCKTKKTKTNKSVYSMAHFYSITILALTLIILDFISQLFWALFRSVTVIHTVP